MILKKLKRRYAVSLLAVAATGCSYVPVYTSEGVTSGGIYESQSSNDEESLDQYDYPLSLGSAYYNGGYYHPYPYPYSYFGIYSVPPRVPGSRDSSQPEPAPEIDTPPPSGGQPRTVSGTGVPRTGYRPGFRPRSGGNARSAVPKSTSTPAAPVVTRSQGSGSDPRSGRRVLNRR